MIRYFGGNARSIEFGSDVIGGKKYTISTASGLSSDELEDVSQIVNDRLNAIGYSGAGSAIENGELVVYASSDQNVSLVLMEGKIEGVIERHVMLSDDVGELQIGDDSHTFSVSGRNVEIDGNSHRMEDGFVLDGVRFRFSNSTNSSVVARAIIFTNDDLRRTPIASGFVRRDQNTRQYYYNVPAEVTFNSSERFSKVVAGLMPIVQFGGNALDGALIFTLDDVEVSRMGIPVGSETTALSTISIVDEGINFRDALEKKVMIQSGVEGLLETELSIDSVENFSGRFNWVTSATFFVILVGLFALVARGAALKMNRNIPVVSGAFYLLIVFYLFGVARFSQVLLTSGWVIDRFSLFGISAFSIIVAFEMIMILERHLKNRRFSKKYNRIIYAIYAVGFVSMFTNFSGFGIALIVGLIISYVVRPMYKDYISRFR